MRYVEIDAFTTILAARKKLKILEINRGPRGGYYTINENHKKRYYKEAAMHKTIQDIAKRDPKEIADACMRMLGKYNASSSKQKKSIEGLGGDFYEKAQKSPEFMDKISSVNKILSPEAKEQIKNSGIGEKIVNAQSKRASNSSGSGSTTDEKEATQSPELEVKKDNTPAVKENTAPAVKKDNTPAVKKDNTPAVKENNDIDEKDDTLDIETDTESKKSVDWLRTGANILMGAALTALACASALFGTDDFTREDIKHAKSYVNVIHDNITGIPHKFRKSINYFAPDTFKDNPEPEWWASDEDLEFFNIKKEDDDNPPLISFKGDKRKKDDDENISLPSKKKKHIDNDDDDDDDIREPVVI